MSPWEAALEALGKYSWRSMLGAFVASGTLLFLPLPLGISDWLKQSRPWLVIAFIVSGTILATYLATYLVKRLTKEKVHLHMVLGNPLQQRWFISQFNNQIVLHVTLAMNFAHKLTESLYIKNAYLKGTQNVTMFKEIQVLPGYNSEEFIQLWLRPIIARPGEILRSKIVFVDQYNHKHVSATVSFPPSERLQNVGTTTCQICSSPIEPGRQAPEAVMPAHTSCIWKSN